MLNISVNEIVAFQDEFLKSCSKIWSDNEHKANVFAKTMIIKACGDLMYAALPDDDFLKTQYMEIKKHINSQFVPICIKEGKK